MTGIINGLLANHRSCPHDKDVLIQIDGVWKFDQVTRSQNRLNTSSDWVPTGYIFTAKLYRCAKCGYVEMVDEQ